MDAANDQALHRAARINDPILKRHLIEALSEPTRYADALSRLATQIYAARDSILYPDQHQPSPPTLEPSYAVGKDENLADGWSRVINDANIVAQQFIEIYLRDVNQGRQLSGMAAQLGRRVHAERTLLALRYQLLSRLYALRATINQDTAGQGLIQAYQQPQDAVVAFLVHIANYSKQVRELRLARALLRGKKEADDAAAFNAWSRDFGHPRDAEIGWGPFAAAVGNEVRYRRHTMELSQRWRTVLSRRRGQRARGGLPLRLLVAPAHWAATIFFLVPARFLSAVGLTLFMAFAGFGLKPRRFALTSLSALVIFSLAYYADEVTSQCKGGARSLADIGRDIVYSVVNLTNNGSSATCGPHAGLLISAESVIGFFLLSVLAAMLFAWLTDR